tara:strand:- start:23138 stop:23515 length:378 start_codon:yes stop_codon:yes gene_type:complete
LYNISVFLQRIAAESHVLKIMSLTNPKKIYIKEMFCDTNQMANYHNPFFHSWMLMAENKLLLSDASCYNIAAIFDTNKFIAIDDPKFKQDMDNVEFVDINIFNQGNTEEKLLEILGQDKYAKYKV